MAVPSAAGRPPEGAGPGRLVFSFEEADGTRPDLFGGKGAGLARMVAAGIPVPPGFIISTEACRLRTTEGRVPEGLDDDVRAYLGALENQTGRCLGSGTRPLLVSVRSGAQMSMPGMMDTILNLGITRGAAVALARESGELDFAVDVCTRFHRMYGEIVLGGVLDSLADAVRRARGQLPPGASIEEVVGAVLGACQAQVSEATGRGVPEDPHDQLLGAINAVFDSWNSRRAITYRNFHKISHDLGTAVVVQMMVFGNLGSPSGTGVAFSRNPMTGERALYGEFLEGGQGEDVVAGTATPRALSVAEAQFPDIFGQFRRVATALEDLYRDAVDVEFTVERGTLYLLQVRTAKRTASAAIRIAADLLAEGLDPALALGQVSPAQVRQVDRPRFQEAAAAEARGSGRLLAVGIGASPGQVAGLGVLDPDRAVQLASRSDGQTPVVLLRPTTSPLDLHGMIAALGIVTSLGGATSHAAVVARALDKPCVVGCAPLRIDLGGRRFGFDGRWFEEGTAISIDGASGEIFLGSLPMGSAEGVTGDLSRLLAVADDGARCSIYGRATTVEQVQGVLDRGASGVTTRIGDVLATTGRLDDLVQLLVSQADLEHVDMGSFEEVIADMLAPVMGAAGDAAFTVRAIDFVADEAMELLDSAKLLAQCPRLALPLGIPELIGAQAAGLAEAARRVGRAGPAQLTVRHLVDPSEAKELRRIAEGELARPGRGPVQVGATLTSVRGVQHVSEIASVLDAVWLEVRGLQAALFGYPPRILLTGEPLDGYLQRHLISSDPRDSLDPSMLGVLASISTARMRNPSCRFGVRLAGPVSEDIASALFSGGFRVIAVDGEEVRPARLAFGRAAHAQP